MNIPYIFNHPPPVRGGHFYPGPPPAYPHHSIPYKNPSLNPYLNQTNYQTNQEGNVNHELDSKLISINAQLMQLAQCYDQLNNKIIENSSVLNNINYKLSFNGNSTNASTQRSVMTSQNSSVPLTRTLKPRSNMQRYSAESEHGQVDNSRHGDAWRTVQPAGRRKGKQTLTSVSKQPTVITKNRFDQLQNLNDNYNENYPPINETISPPRETTLAPNIKEVRGDLFSAPAGCALVHCVGEDLLMGRGIATQFKKRFNNLENLRNQLRRPGQVAVDTRKGEAWPYIFHLVTKKLSNKTPEMENIISSLCELRQCCHILNVTNLAMPKIACGKDKKNWEVIREEINSIFGGTDINITIYSATKAEVKLFSRVERENKTVVHDGEAPVSSKTPSDPREESEKQTSTTAPTPSPKHKEERVAPPKDVVVVTPVKAVEQIAVREVVQAASEPGKVVSGVGKEPHTTDDTASTPCSNPPRPGETVTSSPHCPPLSVNCSSIETQWEDATAETNGQLKFLQDSQSSKLASLFDISPSKISSALQKTSMNFHINTIKQSKQ